MAANAASRTASILILDIAVRNLQMQACTSPLRSAVQLNATRIQVRNTLFCCLNLLKIYIYLIWANHYQPWCQSPGDLAQLGERQTEDLEVNRSIRLIPERIHL